MYDKSKKTWSQRLKITKSEKASSQAGSSPHNSSGNNSGCIPNHGQQSLASFPPTLQIHQIGDYHHGGGGGGGIEFSPSALSRSMKYAEPWIYGTVRGIPARSIQQQQQQAYQQRHHFGQNIAFSPYHALFATPHPLSAELAVVVCSCPEYLTGTKRELKKASICKKCKGSRLPLAPIGGTVRIRPNNSTAQNEKFRATAAATLRVVSSASKARPSILIDSQRDPYDLMRRTRLLSPEPKPQQKPSSPLASIPSPAATTGGGDKNNRNRTKNSNESPNRSRSRNRPKISPPTLEQQMTTKNASSSKNSSSSATSSAASSSATSSPASLQDPTKNRTANVNFDCWLEESSQDSGSTDDSSHRRSILRCNVNPYDLISSKSLSSSSSSPPAAASDQRERSPFHGVSNAGYSNFNDVDLSDDDGADDDDDDDADGDLFKTINHSPSGNNDEVSSVTNSSRQSRISSGSSVGVGVGVGGGSTFRGGPVNYTNVKAIAGQRISLGENTTSSSLLTQNGDGFMFESVNHSANGEGDRSLCQQNNTKTQSHLLSPLTDDKTIEQNETTKQVNQPKRPPRKKFDSNDTDASTLLPTATAVAAKGNDCHRNAANSESHAGSMGSVASQKRGVASNSNIIKSILKRPQSAASAVAAAQHTNTSDSKTATNGTSSVDAANFAGSIQNQQRHHYHQNQKQLKHLPNSPTVKLNQNRNNSKQQQPASPSLSSRSSVGAGGSQFYIPLPQARKKVQFMVEDRIIQASDDDDDDDDDEDDKDYDYATSEVAENANAGENDNRQSMGLTETTSAGATESDETAVEIRGKLGKTSSNYKYYNRRSRNDGEGDCEPKTTKEPPKLESMPLPTAVATSTLKSNRSANASGSHESVVENNRNKNGLATMVEQESALEKLQNSASSPSLAQNADNECRETNGRKEKKQHNSNSSQSSQSRTSTMLTGKNDDQQQQQQQEAIVDGSCNRNDSTINGRKDDYDDVDLRAVVIPATLTTTTKPKTMTMTLSRNPIRRSNSERYPCNSKQTNDNGNSSSSSSSSSTTTTNTININSNNNKKNGNNQAKSSSSNVILNFKDTMALRMKCARTDSRDLFSSSIGGGGGQSGMFRPREPPPPPPTIGQYAGRKTENAKQRANTATTAVATDIAMMTTKDVNVNVSVTAVPPAPPPPPPPPPLAEMLAGKTQTISLTRDPTPAQAAPKDTVTITAALDAAEDAKSLLVRNRKLSVEAEIAAVSATNGLGSLAEQLQCQPHLKVAAAQHQSNSNTSVLAAGNDNKNKNKNNPADYQSVNSLPKPVIKPNNGEGTPNDVEITSAPANIYESFDVRQTANNSSASSCIRGTAIHLLSTKDNRDSFINVISGFRDSRDSTNGNGDRLFVSNHQQTVNVPAAPPTPPQRTVVRVAPFNKTSSEIHRLKIKHADDAVVDMRHRLTGTTMNIDGSLPIQKKTSILINGDDCYSTMNVSNDTAPLYQSSVVVTDHSCERGFEGFKVTTSNTVTINVGNNRTMSEKIRTPEQEIIYKNNKINTLLSQQAANALDVNTPNRAIIPICGNKETSQFDGKNAVRLSASSSSSSSPPKRGRTLITLDYEKTKQQQIFNEVEKMPPPPPAPPPTIDLSEVLSHEEELVKILRNPVEAVRRNLVPHVCGKNESETTMNSGQKQTNQKSDKASHEESIVAISPMKLERSSFIGKLLEDPTLNHVADGLEADVVVKLIENSLKRLKDTRSGIDTSGTKDNDDVNRLIDMSLQRIKEERQRNTVSTVAAANTADSEERQSNRGSISSANSFSSANNYEIFDFDANCESDCYQSCSSEITSAGGDDINDTSTATTRSKFYQMLVDATLAEIEISTGADDDEDDDEHHYESIRMNGDPIYEEINEVPPPLPLSPPPLNDPELEKKAARSMFEGASKYDILSYLVDAKERGLVREETFDYGTGTNCLTTANMSNPSIIEEESTDKLSDLAKMKTHSSSPSRNNSQFTVTSNSIDVDTSSTVSASPTPPPPPPLSTVMLITGGGNGNSLTLNHHHRKSTTADIERNDSGVGSETSKSSRSKYQSPSNTHNTACLLNKDSPIHLCEDCDGAVETQVTESGVMFAPLVCRKCGKKRAERKEIITEIVETEEKYGRDLQIILEEFCQPMLVAGLLSQEQLSAIFLNTEELLENNQTLAERMRDALDIALEQGDDDLLTVNIGKIFLEFTQMLHAFESYCVRQAGSSLLLANLEKEKELLRIFLKVSQMENTVLRRMNLNSFLMVPVQRVTKYPLLLARLYKVTPAHLEGRDTLKQAQEKIELHLNHINQEAKDVPTKLWRRISSSSPNRRASCEIDMINIKLRKMAIDILEWNHDEVRFAMEGKLLYTQPTDSNWKKARTIKLTPVNALLVTNGKPSANYKADKITSDKLNFPKHTGVREASLLVVKEKCGRYTLIREPLYLDRCVVCTEADWDDYFEVQEIASKDTFIFKAEDGVRTKQWYMQLQYHAQGMGAWRKRRNALANIMINGMLSRT